MTLLIKLISLFSAPGYQTPEGTNDFFRWYFYGLGGIGGWIIFFLLAFIAVIWLFYDSQKRKLPATGWRMAVIVLTLFLLPTMLYRFTVTPLDYTIWQLLRVYAQNCTMDLFSAYNLPYASCDALANSLPPMTPYAEYVFYLGLLGGLLAPVVAVAYYITFKDLVGCHQGHTYPSGLARCPECARLETKPASSVIYQPVGPSMPAGKEREPAKPPRPSKPVISFAWLVDTGNERRYDLCEGTTRIGRSADNDVVLIDPAASRVHAQVREANGHCTLSDLDSSTGTLLNGKRLRTPLVLQNGDRITIGDTELQFVRVG